MPSALFHGAIGLLIGMAILGDAFDTRAAVVILFATLVPDLDAVLGIWFVGAHRTYLHNVFVVLVPVVVLLVARWTGYLEQAKVRWPDVERVLWAAIMVTAVAGVGLDAVASGTNLFYPVHDQFYQLHGTVMYSTQHGLEQTVTDMDRARLGSTKEIYYTNGVKPVSGPTPGQVAWRIPFFENTLQLLLSITVCAIIGYRLRQRRDSVPLANYFPVIPVRQTERQR